MANKTIKKESIGDLIRRARLAKSQKMFEELLKDGRRIGRGETPNNIYLQEDLAHDLGTTQSVVSRYESGKVVPGLNMRRKIAAALDIPLIELIGGE